MKPIYCDESVWMPVARGLRERGWNVHTASEEGNLGVPDREQLRIALEKDWILLTFDDDFLSLVEKQDLEHSGIVYTDQSGKTVGKVLNQVSNLLTDNPETEEILIT